MKHLVSPAFAASLAVLCASCTQRGSDCGFLDDGYQGFDGSFTDLAEYPLENVPNEVVGHIQKCWADQPYGGPQHSILLKGARVASSSQYRLIFEPWEISDTYLVFSVERGNRVVDGHVYSTFSAGDPLMRQSESR